MTWYEKLWNLIRYKVEVNGVFHISEIYEHEAEFRRAFPNNKNIRASLRDKLQDLRDDGLIAFLGGRGDPQAGTYKRLQ